jgi:hypothetical protein
MSKLDSAQGRGTTRSPLVANAVLRSVPLEWKAAENNAKKSCKLLKSMLQEQLRRDDEVARIAREPILSCSLLTALWEDDVDTSCF